MQSKTFVVPNISCGHCVNTVQNEVGELEGVSSVVAVEETNADPLVFRGKLRKDRTLIHTVSAPRPRDDEHFHLADEPAKQLLLRRGQHNFVEHRLRERGHSEDEAERVGNERAPIIFVPAV